MAIARVCFYGEVFLELGIHLDPLQHVPEDRRDFDVVIFSLASSFR